MSERQIEITAADLQPDVADRMRKALRVAGLGVQDMADELGFERQTIGRYINGRGLPNRPTLIAWALKTGVPIEWLETGALSAEMQNDRPSEEDRPDLVRHRGLEPRTRWLPVTRHLTLLSDRSGALTPALPAAHLPRSAQAATGHLGQAATPTPDPGRGLVAPLVDLEQARTARAALPGAPAAHGLPGTPAVVLAFPTSREAVA